MAITQSGDKRGAGRYEFSLGGDQGNVRVDVYPSAHAEPARRRICWS